MGLLKDPYNLFETKEFKELEEKISNENPSEVYPKEDLFFYAMSFFPVEKTKVVILGQDPYPSEQAHGLAFSVLDGKIPPSLKNIYEELEDDLGIKPDPATYGNLEHWARQGVLLLNTFLSVKKEKGSPKPHLGWEKFTDSVIERLSQNKENLVFMLWGNFARKKKILIAQNKNHCILEAPHPSPQNANKSETFLKCGHFGKANCYLKKNGLTEIKW